MLNNLFSKTPQAPASIDPDRVAQLAEHIRRFHFQTADLQVSGQDSSAFKRQWEEWLNRSFTQAEYAAAIAVLSDQQQPAPQVQPQPETPVSDPDPQVTGLTHPAAIAVMDCLMNKLQKPVKILNEHRGHRAIDVQVIPTGRKANGAIVPIKDLVSADTTDALRVHAGYEPAIMAGLGHVLISINLPESEWQPVYFRAQPAWEKYENRYDDFPIQFGASNRNEPIEVCFGQADQSHAFVVGGSGSGKTSLLHSGLLNATMRYSPANFQFTIIDTQGTSHQPLFPSRWAWRGMDVADDTQKADATFEAIEDEIHRRKCGFSDAMRKTKGFIENVADYRRYCLRHDLDWFPRVFVLIDEKHELATDFNPRIEKVLNGYRKFGFHVIIGSHRAQTEKGLTATMKTSLPVKIALKTDNADDSRVILGDDRAFRLSEKGDFWIARGGDIHRGLGLYCPPELKSQIVNHPQYRPEPTELDFGGTAVSTPVRYTLNGLEEDIWNA